MEGLLNWRIGGGTAFWPLINWLMRVVTAVVGMLSVGFWRSLVEDVRMKL